jgi:hypothetical protein
MSDEQKYGGFVMDNILRALGLNPEDLNKIKALLELIEVVKSNGKTVIKMKNNGIDLTLNK